MDQTEGIKKDSSRLELGALEFSQDFKYSRADSFFVGIANMSETDKRLVISVFENQIVPATNAQGEIGARFVRKAVGTFVSDVSAIRDLHGALSAALADLDTATPAIKSEIQD